jgi:hypothetical protein
MQVGREQEEKPYRSRVGWVQNRRLASDTQCRSWRDPRVSQKEKGKSRLDSLRRGHGSRRVSQALATLVLEDDVAARCVSEQASATNAREKRTGRG